MNNLLIYFAIPVAIIIFSIALQKIFKNPILVASIIFATLLIVTFAINDMNYLIATIIYTILSFITAKLTCLISSNEIGNNNRNNRCNNVNRRRNCPRNY